MAIFSETITGDATPYEVYGGLTACVHYLLAAISDGAVAFRALAADDQRRMLISATRFIDAQFWQGVATGLAGGTPTTLTFPRTGLTDVTGAALDATNVPPQVVNAAFELAAILADDASVAAAADQGSNVKALGAGSGRIEFFNPTSAINGTGSATLLPTPVDRLIGRWLAAASAALSAACAGFATGVNSNSNFVTCSTCSSSPCCCAQQYPGVGWPL